LIDWFNDVGDDNDVDDADDDKRSWIKSWTNSKLVLSIYLSIYLSLAWPLTARSALHACRPIYRSTPSIRNREPCVRSDLLQPAFSRAALRAASRSRSPSAKLPRALSCRCKNVAESDGPCGWRSDVTEVSMSSLAYYVVDGWVRWQLWEPGDFLASAYLYTNPEPSENTFTCPTVLRTCTSVRDISKADSAFG